VFLKGAVSHVFPFLFKKFHALENFKYCRIPAASQEDRLKMQNSLLSTVEGDETLVAKQM
jgi:hypothetical protein